RGQIASQPDILIQRERRSVASLGVIAAELEISLRRPGLVFDVGLAGLLDLNGGLTSEQIGHANAANNIGIAALRALFQRRRIWHRRIAKVLSLKSSRRQNDYCQSESSD